MKRTRAQRRVGKGKFGVVGGGKWKRHWAVEVYTTSAKRRGPLSWRKRKKKEEKDRKKRQEKKEKEVERKREKN